MKRFLKISREKPLPADGSAVDRLTDEAFLDHIYKKLLGREPDPAGRAHQLKFLRAGNSRAALVLNITEAPEFIFKIVKDNIHAYIELLPIKDERPDRYEILSDRGGGEKTWIFRVREEGDFDWLERKILENGYYERPGVWSFLIDEDKRMLAEIASEFGPRSVLDIGCANGAVLKCLLDDGIRGEGVEISRMALDKAIPEVRDRIHCGDILDLRLAGSYDLVLGLDIFEHLNPRRLTHYIEEIFRLIGDGGYLFANIPAYGKDPAFGEIFPVAYREWDDDIAAGRCFRAIPVDSYGYPKNGHLIGAATEWWVMQFERCGFRRETDVEKALHEKFDAAMDRVSPARRAFYVFSRSSDRSKSAGIVAKMSSRRKDG
ncbi:MAG: methyltransferase domain-containing protein [Candidatus Aminicenantes bacterium]|nr:methyltransferase domain-containing protein [Candidatus Aminicenantes bacterium]